MKKIMVSLVLSLTILLAGCGESTTEHDLVTVYDDMVAVFAPNGEMMELSADTVTNFYDIDPTVVNFKVYTSSSFLAEEIGIFEVTDDVDLEAIATARMDDLSDSFDDYIPEQYEIATKNGTVMTKGNLVCFIVGSSDGYEAAKAVFEELDD